MSTGDTYFGACPMCHRTDGYLNLGRDHVFVCHTHKVAWCVGSNLFPSWRDQSEAKLDRNKALLVSYEEVKPWREAADDSVVRLAGPFHCDDDDGLEVPRYECPW